MDSFLKITSHIAGSSHRPPQHSPPMQLVRFGLSVWNLSSQVRLSGIHLTGHNSFQGNFNTYVKILFSFHIRILYLSTFDVQTPTESFAYLLKAKFIKRKSIPCESIHIRHIWSQRFLSAVIGVWAWIGGPAPVVQLFSHCGIHTCNKYQYLIVQKILGMSKIWRYLNSEI